MLGVHIDRTRDKGGLGADRHGDGVERLFDRAKRRTLCFVARQRRGRVLAFGQAVDTVVEKDDFDVRVAAQRMKQVVAADRERVPVASDHPDAQIGVDRFQARGQRRRPTVDAVDAVGVHVIGEAARAADPRNEDDVFFWNPNIWEHLLHLGEDGVIATPGTPADFLVGYEVLAGQGRSVDRYVRHEKLSF